MPAPRQRLGRHEHRLERNERVLVAVDEQHGGGAPRASRAVASAQMLGADQQAGIAEDRRGRAAPAQADMHRHHRALAEADQGQSRIVEAEALELRVEESVDRARAP